MPIERAAHKAAIADKLAARDKDNDQWYNAIVGTDPPHFGRDYRAVLLDPTGEIITDEIVILDIAEWSAVMQEKCDMGHWHTIPRDRPTQ